jgi:hypothetical protein
MRWETGDFMLLQRAFLMVHRIRNDIHQGKWNGLGGSWAGNAGKMRRQQSEESGRVINLKMRVSFRCSYDED